MAWTTQDEQILTQLILQNQREMVSPKMEAFRNPCRIKLCKGGRGAGAKCLQVGTKIWMYDGTLKPVEDIIVGDKVMGTDSTPRIVLATNKGKGHLWKVKQAHGIDYVVNDDHILTLKKAGHCKNEKGPFIKHGYRRPNGSYGSYDDIVDISINEYISKSDRWKENFNGFKADCIKYSSKKVLIDPYILGAWLGDGNSRDVGITTMDDEVLNAFKSYCLSFGLNERIYTKSNASNKAKTYMYTTNNIGKRKPNQVLKKLQHYNLQSNKHIPYDYLVNSEHSRLELLAGLLDTDGTLRKSKSGYTFAQSNKEFALQVKQLADSLGFKTSFLYRLAKCNGKEFDSYRVNISGDIWRIPCRIERKKIKEEDYKRRTNHSVTYITLEDAEYGDWAGFETDGDHRFLLEDGTVTHNSWGIASLLIQRAHREHIRIGCFREIQRSLEESSYTLMVNTIRRLGYSGWSITKESLESPTGSRIIFRGLKDIQASGQVKGLESFDIFWLEEASSISRESLLMILPTLRKGGSELWASWNPETETDPIDSMLWNSKRKDILRVGLKPGPIDNPWWTEELQTEMEASFLEDPDEAEHIWNGLPRKQGQRSILSRVKIRAAMERVVEPVGKKQLGLDVARFGDDKTTFYLRHGLAVIDHKESSKQDTMTTAYQAWDMVNRNPSIPIVVDDTGVGGGVSDRLVELGAKVTRVNFGGAPADKDKFTSTADELWFLFPIDEVSIPDDPKLMEELSGRQFSYDNKGRRKIESKDDYKKRNSKSPDHADGLLLSYYEGAGVAFPDEIRNQMRARRNRH